MKKAFLVFSMLMMLMSCSDDDDQGNNQSEVIGNWKLIQVYSYPGDGSGTFEDVVSQKTVLFHANGTVTSNGSL
ncbi:MAG: hypothetical protein R2783_06270 [Gelidibacter sp.]